MTLNDLGRPFYVKFLFKLVYLTAVTVLCCGFRRQLCETNIKGGKMLSIMTVASGDRFVLIFTGVGSSIGAV